MTIRRRITEQENEEEAAAEMGWEAAKERGESDMDAEAASELAVDRLRERRAISKAPKEAA